MLTGASFNVRALMEHFGELETLSHWVGKMPDVLCLSQTWLDSSADANSLLDTGYHQHALTNRTSKGGGVWYSGKLIMIW